MMQERGWLPESAVPFRLWAELLKLTVPQPGTARYLVNLTGEVSALLAVVTR